VCPFELIQPSSPSVKIPSRLWRQPDIQLRLPAAAQSVGLKYAQAAQFLELLGLQPPAESAIRSMQKVREIAKKDNDLWVIIDCRWASRGFNSEQAS